MLAIKTELSWAICVAYEERPLQTFCNNKSNEYNPTSIINLTEPFALLKLKRPLM